MYDTYIIRKTRKGSKRASWSATDMAFRFLLRQTQRFLSSGGPGPLAPPRKARSRSTPAHRRRQEAAKRRRAAMTLPLQWFQAETAGRRQERRKAIRRHKASNSARRQVSASAEDGSMTTIGFPFPARRGALCLSPRRPRTAGPRRDAAQYSPQCPRECSGAGRTPFGWRL